MIFNKYDLHNYRMIVGNNQDSLMINHQFMNSIGLDFADLKAPIRIVGIKNGKKIQTCIVDNIIQNIAIAGKDIISLCEKSDEYKKYEQALVSGMPILQNWRIAEYNNEYYIRANTIKDGKYCIIIDKVICQYEDETIELEKCGRSFVDWDSISKYNSFEIIPKTNKINFNDETYLKKHIRTIGLEEKNDIWFRTIGGQIDEYILYINELITQKQKSKKFM